MHAIHVTLYQVDDTWVATADLPGKARQAIHDSYYSVGIGRSHYFMAHNPDRSTLIDQTTKTIAWSMEGQGDYALIFEDKHA